MPWRWVLLLLTQLTVLRAEDDTEPVYQYRLPNTVLPTHYDLRFQPYFDPDLDGKDFATFDGQAIIKVDVLESTNEVRLHTLDMVIESFRVKDAVTRKKVNVTSLDVERETQQLVVRLGSSLEKGRQYVLTATYKGHLRNDNRGIARSYFTNTTTKHTRWMVFTSFEATHARRAFPCWDEPFYKARFRVRISRRPGNIAVSTMPLETTSEDFTRPGWLWDSFAETPLLPPYLLSMTVGPWSAVNASTTGLVPGSCYVVPGHEGRVKEATNVISSALRVAAEKAIGVSLPPGLNKLDCVVIPEPNMEWAVENWGLLTFGESMAMLDESSVDAESLQEVWSTASHEVAHLWFGNLATLRWWSNLWLKEGFASYFQYAIVDEMRPDWEMWSRFAVDMTQSALWEDVKGQRSALYAAATTPSDIEDRYDEVSYHKGGAFIRMLESFLGKELFLKGVRKFLTDRFADPAGVDLEDLFNALGDVSHRLPPGKTVADVMTPWVTQAGFPLVTVNLVNNTLVLTQSKFQAESPERWWVPVTYTCAPLGDRQELIEGLVWLPPDWEAELPIDRNKCKWFIVNLGHKGYFRVQYARSLQQWRRLSAVLRQDVAAVPADGRAQLLDDAFSLAAADLLDYRAALTLADAFLGRDTAPGPWSVAISYFSDIQQRLRFRPGIWQLFTIFLKRLAREPLLQSLSAGPDQHPRRLLKRSLSAWACMRLRLCPDDAGLLGVPTLPQDPDLQAAQMCALQRGPAASQQTLQDALRRDAVPAKREWALSAVACSDNATVIQDFLVMSTNPDTVNTTTVTILQAIDTLINLPSSAAYNATHEIVDKLIEKQSEAVPVFVALLLNLANTKNELKEAQELAKYYENEMVITETSDELATNEVWLTKFARVIYQWLREKSGRAATRSHSDRPNRHRLQSSRQTHASRKSRLPRVAVSDQLPDARDHIGMDTEEALVVSLNKCSTSGSCKDQGELENQNSLMPENGSNTSGSVPLIQSVSSNRSGETEPVKHSPRNHRRSSCRRIPSVSANSSNETEPVNQSPPDNKPKKCRRRSGIKHGVRSLGRQKRSLRGFFLNVGQDVSKSA